MRPLCTLLTLCLAVTGAAAADTSFDFIDPAKAKAAAHPSHAKLTVYFCGTCPSARKFMAGDVKKLADAVAEHQAPLQIICVTPDIDITAIQAYADGIELVGPAMAFDGVNAKNVSTSNILQTDFAPGDGGSNMRVSWQGLDNLIAVVNDPARHGELGKHRFKPEGLSDPKITTLWWALENGNSQALPALIQATKRAKPDDQVGDQIIALHDSVTVPLLAHIETLVSGGTDFATFEALELAISEAPGLDTRDASKHLKTMARDAQIKKELAARSAYQKCQSMLKSRKDKDVQAGKAGMTQIAERMSDTVYGAKAAANL